MTGERRNGETATGGFMLVELLVVCTILGVLASLGLPQYLRQRERAWTATVQSDLKNAAVAQEAYAIGHDGDYAPTDDELATEGLRRSEGVLPLEVTVFTGGYCLKATHLRGRSLWYASHSGPGRPVDASPDPVNCPA